MWLGDNEVGVSARVQDEGRCMWCRALCEATDPMVRLGVVCGDTEGAPAAFVAACSGEHLDLILWEAGQSTSDGDPARSATPS
jgi:hypothetical protein